jgi:hypothetical protein
VNAMGIEEYEKGQTVYDFNDDDYNFYLIGSGEVKMEIQD